MIYVSVRGAAHRRTQGLALWGLANPLYWVLHSIAAYKGLWQLIFKPHYWEKTTHGLTTMSRTSPDDDQGAPASERSTALAAA